MPLINRWYLKIKDFCWRICPVGAAYCQKRKSFIKFMIAGFFSGSLDLLFLFVFHGIFKVEIVLATSISFFLSILGSFFLQKFWTFRDKDHKRAFWQLVMYFSVGVINLSMNGFLMHIFVNRLQVWYLLAQLIVNLLLAASNFASYKFIVFRQRAGREILVSESGQEEVVGVFDNKQDYEIRG